MAMARCLSRALILGLFVAAPLGAQGASGSITGRVLDSATRQPLGSVSIRIVGTQRGVLSRGDGGFTLNAVPAGAQQLRASRIGFSPQVVAVVVPAGGTTTAQFILVAQAAVLNELVVTGYGTQRREAITGSVATVNAAQADVGVISNATQMLQGRVA